VPTVKEWLSYKERKSFVLSDVDRLKQMVLALLGNAEAGRLPEGDMITFMDQAGPSRCDIDLLQYKLGRMQDEIERAKTTLRDGSPGEALAILEGLDAEAIYGASVRQSRHRTLRYKKAAKIRGTQ